MAKAPKFGNVVLCEHVVSGVGNKHTLVNVFSGDIIVSELPARLFFGLYAEYYAPEDGSFKDISIELRLNGKTFARIVVSALGAVTPGDAGVVAVPIFELGVDNDLALSVVARVDGHKPQTLMTKQIRQGTVEVSASAVFPRQSRPDAP